MSHEEALGERVVELCHCLGDGGFAFTYRLRIKTVNEHFHDYSAVQWDIHGTQDVWVEDKVILECT